MRDGLFRTFSRSRNGHLIGGKVQEVMFFLRLRDVQMVKTMLENANHRGKGRKMETRKGVMAEKSDWLEKM